MPRFGTSLIGMALCVVIGLAWSRLTPRDAPPARMDVAGDATIRAGEVAGVAHAGSSASASSSAGNSENADRASGDGRLRGEQASAWAEMAAALTGLQFVALPDDNTSADLKRLLAERRSSSFDELERCGDSGGTVEKGAAIVHDICLFEAASSELSDGRVGLVVEGSVPTAVPEGHEIVLLGGVQADGKRCAALFLFEANKYANAKDARDFRDAVLAQSRSDYARSFNARPLAERRATLEPIVESGAEVSQLLRDAKRQGLGAAEIREMLSRHREPWQFPGYRIETEGWTIVPVF